MKCALSVMQSTVSSYKLLSNTKSIFEGCTVAK